MGAKREQENKCECEKRESESRFEERKVKRKEGREEEIWLG